MEAIQQQPLHWYAYACNVESRYDKTSTDSTALESKADTKTAVVASNLLSVNGK